jgi:four helix bundle protein
VKENILRNKTYAFAIRIVKLSQYLQTTKKEFVLSKQILRSGTSIGALIRESEYGQSKTDFIHKMTIALKEANETEYWINILKDTDYIEERLFKSLSDDCKEIIKLLIASIKTAKQNLKVEN